ncbi:hypothetical protein MNBD_ALPHA05-282, partial [hydrothermal vent metagenome]
NSIAVGANSTASGRDSIAVGMFSTASVQDSTAVGQSSLASGFLSTAVGENSAASGPNSTALGSRSSASGDFSAALGTFSTASGQSSTALGTAAEASGDNSIAIGMSAAATHVNSMAFGVGVATTSDNQIALGTETNTLTVTGITSAASLAAQGSVTGLVTTDASGNLASDGGALQTQVNANMIAIAALGVGVGPDPQIALNMADIATNAAAISELREGMASLASLPDLYLQADESWTAAGGLAAYDDGYGGTKWGFGGGAQFRLGSRRHTSVGIAAATSGSTYTARAQFRIGG